MTLDTAAFSTIAVGTNFTPYAQAPDDAVTLDSVSFSTIAVGGAFTPYAQAPDDAVSLGSIDWLLLDNQETEGFNQYSKAPAGSTDLAGDTDFTNDKDNSQF